MPDVGKPDAADKVRQQLDEVTKVASKEMAGVGYVILAIHDDGYVQYSTSLDPAVAAAVMVDLGKGMLEKVAPRTLIG